MTLAVCGLSGCPRRQGVRSTLEDERTRPRMKKCEACSAITLANPDGHKHYHQLEKGCALRESSVSVFWAS
jgi:hypothetical protein